MAAEEIVRAGQIWTGFDGRNCLEVQFLQNLQGILGKESDIFSPASEEGGGSGEALA